MSGRGTGTGAQGTGIRSVRPPQSQTPTHNPRQTAPLSQRELEEAQFQRELEARARRQAEERAAREAEIQRREEEERQAEQQRQVDADNRRAEEERRRAQEADQNQDQQQEVVVVDQDQEQVQVVGPVGDGGGGDDPPPDDSGDEEADEEEDEDDMAAGVHASMRKALELPIFTGDEDKDKMTGQEFVTRVEYAKRLGTWSDEQTARYVILRLQGLAWSWISSAIEEEKAWIGTWPTLKEEFNNRWVPLRSVSEKVALRRTLIQKDKEKVMDFMDRVKKAEQVFQHSAVPIPDAQKAAAQLIFDKNILFNFMAGLKPAIHEKVVTAGCDTLTEALDNAIKAEKSIIDRKPQNPPVMAVQASGSGRGRSQGQGQSRQRGRRQQKSTRNQSSRGGGGSYGNGNGSGNGKFMGTCWNCGKQGHMKGQCRSKTVSSNSVQKSQNQNQNQKKKQAQTATTATVSFEAPYFH